MRRDGAAVEWGVATRTKRGEDANGDLGLVIPGPNGALVAAVDGVGHGGEAAYAARAAANVVRESSGRDLVELVMRCHDALRQTRGAAITLASVAAHGNTMTWLGVGNVEGRLFSGGFPATPPKGSLALGSGVAGHDLPRVRTASIDLLPGDLLLLATDGVDAAFAGSLDTSGSTETISERILGAHGKMTDDALVVAVRFLGERQ